LTKGELDEFDRTRDAKEERAYRQQLERWEARKKVEAAQLAYSESIPKEPGTTLDDPNIRQLYRGTTHGFRERLYVQTTGGLSFEIRRDSFGRMVRGLAQRTKMKVTEEQISAMFNTFDVDGSGAVSYMEYLAILTDSCLTAGQKRYLDRIFMDLQSFEQEGRSGSTPIRSQISPQSHARRSRDTSKVENGPQSTGIRYLRLKDITAEKLRDVVLAVRHQNPWFPHPKEEALIGSILRCFRHLKPTDRIKLEKFRMFIYCDDQCMHALEGIEPSGD
jgi:hypothetical protein